MKNDGKKKLLFAIKLILIDTAIALIFYFTIWRILMVALRMLGVIAGFIVLIATEISITKRILKKNEIIISEKTKVILTIILIFVPLAAFFVFFTIMMMLSASRNYTPQF
ncbi:MAG: hypothetical protein LBL80_02340 [Ruminococcus sp.]|jgi:hypothetical protein|nr:hypothetical protein [Ruminococcus sp.]